MGPAPRRRVSVGALGTVGVLVVAALGVVLAVENFHDRANGPGATVARTTTPSGTSTSAVTTSGSSPGAGNGTPKTSPTSAPPASTPAATTTPPRTSGSPSPTATPSVTPTQVTLDLLITGKSSFVTVRIPGGATLFSGLAEKGKSLRYDQTRLRVVLGSSGNVRILVNGKPKASLGSGLTQSFTVTKA